MTRLLIASTNRGKLAEIRPVVGEFGLDVVGLDELDEDVPTPVEDGETFAANARLKAAAYARATGLLTLADDSGLEVDALGGAPGVHSARYAGPEADDAANLAELCAALRGRADRRARFRCALCVFDPATDRPVIEVSGACEGTLLETPRGDGGFGYDPLFVADADPERRTFAELSRELKRGFSHRGAALAALRDALAARGEGSVR